MPLNYSTGEAQVAVYHPEGIRGSHLPLLLFIRSTEAASGDLVQAAATVVAAPEAVLIMRGREVFVIMMGDAAGAVAEGSLATTL